jgi:hypothetical protein
MAMQHCMSNLLLLFAVSLCVSFVSAIAFPSLLCVCICACVCVGHVMLFSGFFHAAAIASEREEARVCMCATWDT